MPAILPHRCRSTPRDCLQREKRGHPDRLSSSLAAVTAATHLYRRAPSQYGFAFRWLAGLFAHQTRSPVFTRNLAFSFLISLTTSLATHLPPSMRNMVRCTPGNSFTSSTEAEVTQPLNVESQRVYLALAFEGHDYPLYQLMGRWVMGQLHMPSGLRIPK